MRLQHGLNSRPKRWTGLIAKHVRARAIRGSNSIEGYHVSNEAALAALDGDRPDGTDETAWENVVNYQAAMEYVLLRSSDSSLTYGRELLFAIHYHLLKSGKNPGRFRAGPIYVSNSHSGETVYTGPDIALVPDLVDELCAQLTEDDANIEGRMLRAAMAHLNLVLIHPFADGNGRSARALQTLVLASGELEILSSPA